MSDNRQTLFALGELINVTRTLADTLKDTARALHQENSLSVSERSILLDLRKHGPQTVPDLARRREVSRQFIQATVNPLLEEGVLEAQGNPAHRRSKLIVLTDAGVQLIRQVMKKEGSFMTDIATDLNAEEIRQAAETLARVQGLVGRDNL
ncbi:MAG: MarR family winged helix-turn-helix transcriptional regulator [Candidatus Krumholzibacteria bacterium]|nr:MarR family winged helix-turn-helix transcriptional regulator [Candidatus Krumholzibacteria bacterium]